MWCKWSEKVLFFYEKLEYNQKRVLQKLLFSGGLQYSLKNKEYLTSKTGA
jgi:hypothetical protein